LEALGCLEVLFGDLALGVGVLALHWAQVEEDGADDEAGQEGDAERGLPVQEHQASGCEQCKEAEADDGGFH
jgi:hypothetical protein